MPAQSELLSALLLGTLLLVSMLWMRAEWRARAPKRNARRARNRGADGEKRAIRLLRSLGYEIVGEQVTGTVPLLVDGTAHPATVRADFLVRRGGRMFVADAKSGANPQSDRATRRQLLEYLHAYDVDGVLLVDTHAGTVRTLALQQTSPAVSERGALLILGLALAVLYLSTR